mgnify:CR=1 FL=1|jgi:hypothetical protein
MRIEQGIDLNGNPMFFVLNEADLLASFSSQEEARDYIANN